jgi:hypothetical protein
MCLNRNLDTIRFQVYQLQATTHADGSPMRGRKLSTGPVRHLQRQEAVNAAPSEDDASVTYHHDLAHLMSSTNRRQASL